MKPAAFFFDLDGTLADTERPWTEAIVAFLADRSVAATYREVVELICGRSWFDIHAELHRRHPSLPAATPAEDAVHLRAYYDRIVSDPASVIIESSMAFLKRALALAPVAIVSGSPRKDVMAIARLGGVAEKLAFVLGVEDYARGKPLPDGYLAAARRLGAEPADCVVVEDSTVGVLAGRAAGMKVIALDRGLGIHQDLSAADWRVRDLSEFDLESMFEMSGV